MGDSGNGFDAALIGDCRLFRLFAENYSHSVLGLLQHNRHFSDAPRWLCDFRSLGSIETIDKQQITQEEQLTAAAPQLSIDLHADGTGRVNLGGSAVTGPFRGPLVDLTQIEIATITLTPPFSDAKVAETKRSKLAADLQIALHKAGVETVAEAVAAITLRRDFETKRRGGGFRQS
ncbi:hypothetical protein [Bradyrhizobium valentinum]|uniref:Uncharacterized protein n=1 Tax=Bradyrhizobium valentinum TaxID=1518501 RepID=A0A0R3L5S5_9BRAD|nr:hypothetical protein [Bradyrhizobium valentinum]KRR03276.1 hypothetical protein CP49_15180 [Bradyrhizobium valentinum]